MKLEEDREVYDTARPIKSTVDKSKILPLFMETKGLVKQHVDSYNFFVQTELRQIVRAHSNRLIKSDVDPNFFIEFIDARVGSPMIEEAMVRQKLTPIMCRTRDLTYSAPILVDVDLYRQNHIVRRRNIEIGRIPVMLKSCVCILNGKTEEEIMMLGECPCDTGGYFVVKGTEKVILMQEQLSKNRIIVETDFKHNICASVTSASAEAKTRTTVVYKHNKLYLRHNSFVDDIQFCIVLRAMGIETDQEIVQIVGDEHYELLYMSLHDLHVDEILNQHDALTYIAKKMKLRTSGKGAGGFNSYSLQTGPPKELPSTNNDDAWNVLSRVVLAHIEHCNIQAEMRFKSVFLCLMARRVLDAIRDKSLIDDKDYYGNKRLELAGQLISLLFEDLFKRFASQTKKLADQALTKYMQMQGSRKNATASNSTVEYPDCFHNPMTSIITKGMQFAISTGNWTIKRFRMERSGVSQVLSRLSYIAFLGVMSKINSQFEKGRKVSGPRALQPSQWGVLCPCDTPEGESCGLVKNLALLTHVTTDEDPNRQLFNLMYSLGVEDSTYLGGEDFYRKDNYLVFLNGLFLGIHRQPSLLIQAIRNLRRQGLIGRFVNVYKNPAHRTVYLASDSGRLCRPLIVVKNGKSKLLQQHIDDLTGKKMAFHDLFKQGIVEWIDVNEQNDLLIAINDIDITSETTHVEIDAVTLLDAVAGLIPYPHHNQSPRNTYQCAMGKQAMGAVAYNQFSRWDTLLYLLTYPQKPLCKTKSIELVNYEKLPAGQNATVAVMSYSGYDIEDAIVMNRASIERGFGRCFALRRFTVEMQKYTSGTADICVPPTAETNEKTKSVWPTRSRGSNTAQYSRTRQKYEALDQDGIAAVGSKISEEMIYVNRYAPLATKENANSFDLITEKSSQSLKTSIDLNSYRPKPVVYRTTTPSYTDRICCTENEEGIRIYKVLLRQTRLPELGDKFSSRHGQKGVVGLIVDEIDLPFSEDGMCPDLIMNPHGFPSRMTVGKMIELLASKTATMQGQLQYGTAFGGASVAELGKQLFSHGFHYSGKQLLTSGTTGEVLESYIFFGPVFYQKLKHMVQDKIHARGVGPRQALTRQPTEGRAKEGGLRLGEMERDCLVAYGTSSVLLERLMYSSDVFECFICKTCGFIVDKPMWCGYCSSSDFVVSLNIPYASKLLFQELQAMGVSPRIRLSQK